MEQNEILFDEFFNEVWDYVSGTIVHNKFFVVRNDYLRELTYSIYDFQRKTGNFNTELAGKYIEIFIATSKNYQLNFVVEDPSEKVSTDDANSLF